MHFKKFIKMCEYYFSFRIRHEPLGYLDLRNSLTDFHETWNWELKREFFLPSTDMQNSISIQRWSRR